MPATPCNNRQDVAVIGAAGRVGRAVIAALLHDDHDVTAVLRHPAQHELPPDPKLRVVQGDAQYPGQMASILRTVDAVVLAVTPFTAPLIAIGLTAALRLDSGELVMDDPALFPPRLRPFAEAHARELSALRNATTLDWAILTPPAGFGTERETGSRAPVSVDPGACHPAASHR